MSYLADKGKSDLAGVDSKAPLRNCDQDRDPAQAFDFKGWRIAG